MVATDTYIHASILSWIVVVCLLLSVPFTIRESIRLWTEGPGRSIRPQAWWPWSPDLWRAFIRIRPWAAVNTPVLVAVFACLSVVEDGHMPVVLGLVLIAWFLQWGLLLVTIVLFNRPKFTVPPSMRADPGLLRLHRKAHRG
jgi:hypothetical protein